jgi:DNA-binding PadR family transcriptional regulator
MSYHDVLCRDMANHDTGRDDKGRRPEDHLPLTPAVFHVLLALTDGDAHGYAIMKEVEARTGGEVRLGTGTLYGIVKRLLADGWIKESALGSDDRRRTYRLTPFGRRVALAEAERLQDLVLSARHKRLLEDPGKA